MVDAPIPRPVDLGLGFGALVVKERSTESRQRTGVLPCRLLSRGIA